MFDDQFRPLCVGEVKTGWNKNDLPPDQDTLLQAMRLVNEDDHNPIELPDPLIRKWFGQIALYLKLSRLRYDYITTYNTTVFLKLETYRNKPYLLYSNPILSSTTSQTGPDPLWPSARNYVSLRECMLFYMHSTTQARANRSLMVSKNIADLMNIGKFRDVSDPQPPLLHAGMIIQPPRRETGSPDFSMSNIRGLTRRSDSFEGGTLYDRSVEMPEHQSLVQVGNNSTSVIPNFPPPAESDPNALAAAVQALEIDVDIEHLRKTHYAGQLAPILCYYHLGQQRLWRWGSDGKKKCIHPDAYQDAFATERHLLGWFKDHFFYYSVVFSDIPPPMECNHHESDDDDDPGPSKGLKGPKDSKGPKDPKGPKDRKGNVKGTGKGKVKWVAE